MTYRNRRIWKLALAVLTSGLLFTGCQKTTDERNAVTDPSLQQNLMELISAQADLSTFAGYLTQTGYDKVISSSRTYTVFAPTNSEIASLDAGIRNNADRLKIFVGNHIASQLFYTNTVTAESRIQMLNGKYLNMKGTKFGTAQITIKDQYASNGVLQVISKMQSDIDNCWDVLSTYSSIPANQKAFMLSLFRNVFDPTNAVVTGINPTTGEPIYQAGTDSVYTNLFWNKVADLRDEKKQFTLFVLADAAWDAEQTRWAPYFVTNTPDSNVLVTGWNVVRDFAVDTLYEPASIPDTILSESGTKLPIERTAILSTIRTSNGIVYIMNRMNVQPASKFKTITVEGESYAGTSHDRRSNTYFRDRYNTLTGQDFKDVLVLGHGVALFNIRYRLSELPSIKYKVYWTAVNDFQTANFTMRFAPGASNATTFGYTTITPNNYGEVYIGEFTLAQYQALYDVYLVGANSTSSAVNPLVCDYFKLVPSL